MLFKILKKKYKSIKRLRFILKLFIINVVIFVIIMKNELSNIYVYLNKWLLLMFI